MNCRPFILLALACPAALLQAGCGEKEDVESYIVPTPHVLHADNHVKREVADPHKTTGPHAAADPHRLRPLGIASKGPLRMIGAIIPQGERTWSFMLVGGDKAVQSRLETILKFIGSIRFSGGEDSKPSWTLPADWRQQPASGMRYATLQIDSDKQPLVMTVIPLSSAGPDPTAYVLSNVNRWRKQFDLPEIAKDQLSANEDPSEETRQLDVNGVTVTLVNIVRPEMPAGKSAISSSSVGSMGSGSAAAPSLTYKTPEGWLSDKVGGMRKAAFRVSQGEQQVEITVIDLLDTAGELLPNINRWRQQIQLVSMTQQELDREIKPMKVGAAYGHYIELISPKDAKRPETILGAIAIHAGRSWFFKLKGDTELAEREKKRFEEFVQSVNFQGCCGAAGGK